MSDKQKLLTIKIISIIIGVILAIILASLTSLSPNAKLVKDNSQVQEYNLILNQTKIMFDLEFDNDIKSGHIKVVFYDVNDEIAYDEEIEINTISYNRAIGYIILDGRINNYEITECEFKVKSLFDYTYLLIPIIVFVLVIILLSSCKYYDYNGKKIVVYSGTFKNYLKIDEKIVAENKIFLFSDRPLLATLEDGTKITVNFASFKTIVLKINGEKYKKKWVKTKSK